MSQNVIERARDWLDASAEGIRTPQYANALIGELLAIVERLPVTADGVPVVPCVDDVWHPDRLKRGWVSPGPGEMDEDDACEFPDDANDPRYFYCRVSDCYSTRAAAEEARKRAAGGGE